MLVWVKSLVSHAVTIEQPCSNALHQLSWCWQLLMQGVPQLLKTTLTACVVAEWLYRHAFFTCQFC